MAIYLKITDGTTTIDLVGNDAENSFNLLAKTWGPNVSRLKASQLGGHQYEDVVEEIPLYVKSSTGAATVLSNIDTLAALLDQAARWYRGENVSAVTIQFSPNSDSVYLEAAILGPVDSGIELAENFGADLFQNSVDRITLKFLRRGLWLAAEETKTRTASTGYNPGVMTPSANFTDSVLLPAPIKISLDTDDTGDGARAGVVLFAKSTDRLALYEAQDFSTSGPWTTVTDSLAHGGEIKRYDPTTFLTSNAVFSITLNNDVKAILAYLNIENRSSDIVYTVKLEPNDNSGFFVEKEIDFSTTNPRVIGLGLLQLTRPPSGTTVSLTLTVTASKLGVTADSLDIDLLAFVGVSDNVGRAVTLEPINFGGGSGVAGDQIYDHRSLTHPTPIIYDIWSGTTVRPVSDNGDGFIVGVGNTIAILPIINTGTRWAYRATDNSRMEIGLTATRRKGHLIPQ